MSPQHIKQRARGDSTVNDIPDGLEARPADGPLARVERERLAVQPVEHDVAPEVECRIDCRGDKGEGGGGNGGIDCIPISTRTCGDGGVDIRWRAQRKKLPMRLA